MTDTEELAETIEALSDEQQRMLAEFVEALANPDDEEVEAYKASLVGGNGRKRAAGREESLEDMDIDEQKEALLGLEE